MHERTYVTYEHQHPIVVSYITITVSRWIRSQEILNVVLSEHIVLNEQRFFLVHIVKFLYYRINENWYD